MLWELLPVLEEMKLHGRPGELGAHALPSGGRRGGTSPGAAPGPPLRARKVLRPPPRPPAYGGFAPRVFPRELPARPHQYGFIPAGRHSGRARPRTVCEALLRGDGAGASAGTRNIRGVHAPGSSRASTPRRSDSAAASPHEEARPRSIRIRRVPFEQPLPLKDLKEPSRTCGAPSGRARRSPDRGEDE